MTSATRQRRSAASASGGRPGVPRLLAVALLAMALLLVSCGATTTPPVVIPRLGQGVAGALSYAATVNGPDAWAWKISVPQNRLLLYYWITGDFGVNSGSPYIGTTNETDLMAKIQQQSAVYQALDPSHPVVSAFDLVAPVIEYCNSGYGPYNNYWPSDTVIQHFITLAQQNHMLFFFDVNNSLEPISMIVDRLWKYLQEPNVELALDSEYDYTWDNGCLPGLAELHANEINPVIDRLAALSATSKIPPKILILYQWYPEALPDAQNIVLKPGVSVITCLDSVGGQTAKIAEYNQFDNLQRIQYPGYKAFYTADTPPLTPQQILALTPPPIMVAYQ